MSEAWRIADRSEQQEQAHINRRLRIRFYLLWRRYRSGDKLALFEALERCTSHRVPLPEWVARAIADAYDRLRRFEIKSWDDVFGRPMPKGTHANNARHRVQHRIDITHEIKRLKKAGTTIDFDEVGRKFGVSATVCKELYGEVIDAEKAWIAQIRRKVLGSANS
jgi:hypothetical protein